MPGGMRLVRNARLAAWTAPSPVPARTARAQNCVWVSTKNAATTTAVHWHSVIITTRLGPSRSVGPAQHSAPISAETWTTM